MASTVTAADLKVKITEEIILNGKDQGGTTELTIGSINEVYKRIMNDKDKLLELKKWKRFITEQNVRISKKLFEKSV